MTFEEDKTKNQSLVLSPFGLKNQLYGAGVGGSGVNVGGGFDFDGDGGAIGGVGP